MKPIHLLLPLNSAWKSLPILLAIGLTTAGLHAAPPQDANGATPRPFYIVAHNPNTVADVEEALQAGANALEPDITKAYDQLGTKDDFPDTLDYLVDWDSSLPYREGVPGDTRFVDWLQGVHNLALKYPNQIALITFDTKTSAAKSALGPIILRAIRENLNTNGVQIPFVISVGSTNDGAVFDNILTSLGPTEGVQVDGQNDPAGVLLYFAGRGYMKNVTIGDGGAGAELPLVSDSYWTDMDMAAYLRAKTGNPKTLPYLYIYNNADDQNRIVDGGEDGIIPDVPTVSPINNPTFNPQHIADLRTVVAGRGDIRLATPLDNPFQPANEAYTMEIVTGTDANAGTDAILQFTLTGTLGTSSILVDSDKWGRMESGSVDHVTIPSKNLGQLLSLTIVNRGNGNAPGWELKNVAIFSARWLSPVSGANFYTLTTDSNSQWINANQVSIYTLTKNGGTAYTDSWVYASSTALPPDGSFAHPWQDFYSGNRYVQTNGTVHLGAGNYVVGSRLEKRSKLAGEASYGTGVAHLTAR